MTAHITLISSGATAAVGNATFGGDAPLDPREHARAMALRPHLPAGEVALCGPDAASRQTAEWLVPTATIEPQWREIDFGDWTGKPLAAVQKQAPDVLAAWLGDPASPAPGGESIAAFIARIGAWLDLHRDASEKILAIAPANCLRAATLHCLHAPALAFRAIDIMPLTVIRLSAYRGVWRLRLGDQPSDDPLGGA